MNRITNANRLALMILICMMSFLMINDWSVTNHVLKRHGRDLHMTKVRRSIPHYSQRAMQSLHKERKAKLEKECRLAYEPPYSLSDLDEDLVSLKNIIVDDKNKLLYCYVPKVASTNWKRILLILTGKMNTSDPLSIPANDAHQRQYFNFLSDLPANETLHRIRTYKKFMFARHPFERLVSAYINKFVQNYSDYFQSQYGPIIIEKYRESGSSEKGVTFPEFAQYVADPETREEAVLNEHWRPITEICAPCHIHYDILGMHETLDDDSWFVFEEMGLGHSLKLPVKKKKRKTNWKFYFSQLTPKLIRKLYKVYELDFKLFDYTTENWAKVF